MKRGRGGERRDKERHGAAQTGHMIRVGRGRIFPNITEFKMTTDQAANLHLSHNNLRFLQLSQFST